MNGRDEKNPVDAEAAVLGSMIINPECISQVVEQLNKMDGFHSVEHRKIFAAIIALYNKNRGEGLDAVLLCDELKRRKQLKRVGGAEYIKKLLDSVPSSANVMYYAKIVRDNK